MNGMSNLPCFQKCYSPHGTTMNNYRWGEYQSRRRFFSAYVFDIIRVVTGYRRVCPNSSRHLNPLGGITDTPFREECFLIQMVVVSGHRRMTKRYWLFWGWHIWVLMWGDKKSIYKQCMSRLKWEKHLWSLFSQNFRFYHFYLLAAIIQAMKTASTFTLGEGKETSYY